MRCGLTMWWRVRQQENSRVWQLRGRILYAKARVSQWIRVALKFLSAAHCTRQSVLHDIMGVDKTTLLLFPSPSIQRSNSVYPYTLGSLCHMRTKECRLCVKQCFQKQQLKLVFQLNYEYLSPKIEQLIIKWRIKEQKNVNNAKVQSICTAWISSAVTAYIQLCETHI